MGIIHKATWDSKSGTYGFEGLTKEEHDLCVKANRHVSSNLTLCQLTVDADPKRIDRFWNPTGFNWILSGAVITGGHMSDKDYLTLQKALNGLFGVGDNRLMFKEVQIRCTRHIRYTCSPEPKLAINHCWLCPSEKETWFRLWFGDWEGRPRLEVSHQHRPTGACEVMENAAAAVIVARFVAPDYLVTSLLSNLGDADDLSVSSVDSLTPIDSLDGSAELLRRYDRYRQLFEKEGD